MKSTIQFEPAVLQWARIRAGLRHDQLAHKVIGKRGTAEHVYRWEATGQLTFHQAELLAEKTHTPFGFLFLKAPPKETLPISDFRTIDSAALGKASPDLLAVIYQCQQRQSWYREYLVSLGAEKLDFVGNLNTEYPLRAAEDIRTRFNIGPFLTSKAHTWDENLTLHFEALEENGVLVMRSGVVGNNNTRKLTTDEFRGFALIDEYAPLIFINSRDALAAQLFTVVHELVHVCLGESAVSNPIRSYATANHVEKYCNTVAAEVLVPIQEFQSKWNTSADPLKEIHRLRGRYKVSSLVIARRAQDAGFITHVQFRDFYDQEAMRYQRQARKDTSESGGNFYNTLSARTGNRFARAVIASTFEGRTTYTDAFRMLGINNTTALRNFATAKYGYEFG
jgi:Zn-dependent peptidase ImmA (M78 family)